MALAMKLNGLLASPAFAAWAAGPALDIQSMLYAPDGKPRCAIVTTAHLSDEERQFVTSLILAKLVTWMRRQSGTTDLRALLYMDEVAGYLPPTANPPTKKPIMTLMKQARAFGLGVVLSTQNPVDVDYKALSNAGTWMIGRLQTDRDKQRLLDGMSSASGGVDIAAVDATISGLAKREFVLRRAGKDHPEVFTTRWAMSYLRGPLTRDQISAVMTGRATAADATPAAQAAGAAGAGMPPAPGAAAATELAHDETTVMPKVADGVPVRWVDVAAPWLADAGGDSRGSRLDAAVVARVRLRYDDTKAGLLHDEEYECVVTPLTETVDVAHAVAVDYDDRDLRTEAPAGATYRIPSAPIAKATFFSGIERDLKDHLARSLSMELQVNTTLKLYARPDETADAFVLRCAQVADQKADAEIAALRQKYESKAMRLRDELAAAEDRIDVLEAEADSKRNSELLSTAGSILGGLLGGRSRGGVLGKLGGAAGRRGRSKAARERVGAAEGKAARVHAEIEQLEAELAEEITEIDSRWMAAAKQIETAPIALERSDVAIAQLALAWLPTA
jgi:hypothetical protein